jgi:pimeloyl-ACP methyl ester carboxylesterase
VTPSATLNGSGNGSGECFAPSGELEIAYDVHGSPDDPPLLIIPGLGTQLIYWDLELCEMLVQRGLRVVRMDNRDAGHSTVLNHLGHPPTVPMLFGIPRGLRYTLADMADDVIAVLDHLGEPKAHLAGYSMGGMIAQTVAIRHPDRVSSLCSIMSRTGARQDAFPGVRELIALFRATPRDMDEYLERLEMLSATIGSRAYPADPERLRRLARLGWERGIHRAGTARQLHAISCQPDRSRDLGRVTAPTLVMHGSADRLVFPRGGRATARAIPGARLRVYDGMAHDLPQQLWPQFAAEIQANAERAL